MGQKEERMRYTMILKFEKKGQTPFTEIVGIISCKVNSNMN